MPSVEALPVPTRPIPILIGGHAEPALRRAARSATAGCTPAATPRALHGSARLGELRREHGREREPFEMHVISLDAYTLDGVRRLEDLGVTDAIVGFRNAYVKDDADAGAEDRALSRFAER